MVHSTKLIATVAAVVSTMAAAAPAQVVTTSSGDVALLATLNQKNVIDHLIVGDSVEVEMAQLAASRTQNAAVRDYANMLVKDHSAHLDNLRKLADKKDIGREANPIDTSGAHLAGILSRLRSMGANSPVGFDRAFIQAQIDHHNAAIAGFVAMKPAAKDDDVQQDMDKTLPVLQNHLSRAKEVLAQLGAPPADSMMKMKKPPTR